MKELKIVILGNQHIGETTLARALTKNIERNPFEEMSLSYYKHIFDEADTTLSVFAVKEAYQKEKLGLVFKDKPFVLYCVDSQAVDITKIKNDLASFPQASPQGKIILVATQGGKKRYLDQIQKEINAEKVFDFSRKGFDELLEYLIPGSNKLRIVTEKQQKSEGESEKILKKAITDLSQEKKDAIATNLRTLRKDISNPTKDIVLAFERFNTNCHIILEGEHPNIMNAVLSFSAALFVMTLVSAIGFAIGFAAGLWLGPGAFLTALAGGEVAAVTVMSVASTLGVIGGGLTSWGLFKPSKEALAIDEFTQGAKEIYCPTVTN